MSPRPKSRNWRVHVVQSTHVMLGWARGYQEAQDYCDRELYNQLELMDETDDYPQDEQQRYLLDSNWPLTQFLRRYPQETPRVRRRVREGRLEVSAYEASVPDQALNGEEVIRCFLNWRRMERLGLARGALAVFTDIHSFSLNLPSLMAGCGVRYCLIASNTEPSVGFEQYPDLDVIPRGYALFWWKGPDGHRVLCYNYGSYYEASGAWNGGEFDPALVRPFLDRLEAKGEMYPADAAVLFGTGGDAIRDGGFYHTLEGTNRIREWNRARGTDDPYLINGRLQAFFEYVESRFGDRLPVFEGGWGGGDMLWDTQSQRYGKTGLQARQGSARVRTAETVAATNSALFGAAYPSRTIRRVFRYRLWHDEHDANATRNLVSDVTKQEWRATQQHWGSRDIEQPSIHALQGTLRILAAHLPDTGQPSLLVVNPTSHARTDVVRWPCSDPGKGRTWRVIDGASGADVPTQWVRRGRRAELAFLARELPPLGYRVYHLAGTEPQPPSPFGLGPRALEGPRFRLVCSQTGALESLYDKAAGREVLQAGGTQLFEDNGATPRAAYVEIENAGPLLASLLIRSEPPSGTELLETRLTIYTCLDRVDVESTFWLVDGHHEIAYEWPFDLSPPVSFLLEGPAGTLMVPGRREFDEARLDYWNTHSFVDVSSPEYGVTLASPDARQVYMGPEVLPDGRLHSSLREPRLRIRAIGGGPEEKDHYDDNGGPLDNPYRYRFALAPHPGPVDPVHALRQGWEAVLPLVAAAVRRRGAQPCLPPEGSAWRVPQPLFVSAFKRAEHSATEFILRLWNPAPQRVTGATIASDLFAITSARINDHVERDTGPNLPVAEGACQLDVPGAGFVTVRLTLTRR